MSSDVRFTCICAAQQRAQQDPQRHHAWTPRVRSRNGAMDGLGLHTFDAASFENTLAHVAPVRTQSPIVFSSRGISTLHITSHRLIKSICPAMKSPTISWTILPRHTTRDPPMFSARASVPKWANAHQDMIHLFLVSRALVSP
jgi:hypothetical protein